MVGVLIRMRWRVVRHSLHGKQAAATVLASGAHVLVVAVVVVPLQLMFVILCRGW